MRTARNRVGLVFAALAALPLGCSADGGAPPSRPAVAPVVLGADTPGLQERVRGLVLLGELGCVACHADRTGQIDVRRGPDLTRVGARVRHEHLTAFLAQPLQTEPGTVMPDLHGDRDEAARREVGANLAAYLRSFAAAEADEEAADAAAALRGHAHYHDLGCVVCHPPRDASGAEQPAQAAVSLRAVAAKYSSASLRAFLAAPHAARPARRMPDLRLSPTQVHELTQHLRLGARAPAAAPTSTAHQIEAGRASFGELGCVRCHALPDGARRDAAPPAPLHELEPTRGCLSEAASQAPRYALRDDQRAAITAALRSLAEPLTDEARVLQLLSSRNCLACHERGDFGGVTAEREPFFGTDDPTLGPEARLPPPLTKVGAKLQRAWLVDAIAHGQDARPYVHTRMPGFGAAFAEELATLLTRVDLPLPQEVAPLPDQEEERRAVLDLGRELVGEQGMNCITCHRFAGQQVGAMGAIDLVESTGQRLQPQWFAHFLRAPFAWKPNTLMPQFFPGGVSTRPELGGGDTARQIDAMWHYLAEGRNVRQPSGMRRPSIELQVEDEAVLLRRSVQHTGKRGIAVGLPGGVNVTFDAERLAMNQIWWGRFVDAAPVWSGQGSGEARILSRQRAGLPVGPAIAVLAAPDDPWPTASRRELGHRWLGYDLDPQQRPSFRYVCADVEVTDSVRERVAAGAGTVLQRTLRFAGAVNGELQFRIARHARIEAGDDGAFRVGEALRVRSTPAAVRLLDVEGERELRLAVPLREGAAELVVEYSWLEGGK